jgi:hypothetical protein
MFRGQPESSWTYDFLVRCGLLSGIYWLNQKFSSQKYMTDSQFFVHLCPLCINKHNGHFCELDGKVSASANDSIFKIPIRTYGWAKILLRSRGNEMWEVVASVSLHRPNYYSHATFVVSASLSYSSFLPIFVQTNDFHFWEDAKVTQHERLMTLCYLILWWSSWPICV